MPSLPEAPAGRPGRLPRWCLAAAALGGVVLACSGRAPLLHAQSSLAAGGWSRVVVLVRSSEPTPRAVEAVVVEPLAADADGDARNAWRGRRDRALLRAADRAHAAARERVAAFIEAAGGRVTHRFAVVPGLAATLPDALAEELRRHPEVVSVSEDRRRRALLDTLPQALGLQAFTDAGVTAGTVDVAVADSGIYLGHDAFRDAFQRPSPRYAEIIRLAQAASACPGEFCGVSPIEDATSALDFQGHGTEVAGVLASQGFGLYPNHLGVAHGLGTLVNVKVAFRTGLFDKGLGQQVDLAGLSAFDSDIIAGLEAAIGLGVIAPEVISLSLGAPTFIDPGDPAEPYDVEALARFLDAVVAVHRKVIVVAAGNGGATAASVESPAIAYNVLAVGAASTQRSGSRADDQVWAGSSRGPTQSLPGLARKKPDLVAPGDGLITTTADGGVSDAGGTEARGTSLAAPAVAGLAALLWDAPGLGGLHINDVFKPLAIRALLINSAEDRNVNHPTVTTPDGWDPAWGWGYVDGAKAYEQRAHLLLRPSGLGSSYWVRSTAAPTKATVVWDRPVWYPSGTAQPLPNLDMFLYGLNDGARRAQSTSAVDNVEQVASSVSEPVVLRVDQTTDGPVFEAFVAHTGGFARAVPATLDVTAEGAKTGPGGGLVVAAWLWGGSITPSLPVFDARARITLPPGYVLEPGETAEKPLGTLTTYPQRLRWAVRAPAAADPPRTFTVRVTGGGFDVTHDATGAATLETSAGCAYGPQPSSITLSWGGEATSLAFPATLPADCAWSVTGVPDWLIVNLTSGLAIDGPLSGRGPATFLVAVNSYAGATPRSATVVFGNVPVTVTQEAMPPSERTYYLAEGATGPFFDLDVAIANPNDATVNAEVTFLKPGGATQRMQVALAPKQQRVIRVDEIAGLEDTAVSTVVKSPGGAPLVVERTMFWDGAGYGGHGGTAVDGPRTTWYFAEGSQGFFDTFVLLANANAQVASVRVTFLREGGEPPFSTTVTVGPNARENVWTRLIPELANRSFSIVVESDVPIIAERAMYFPAEPAQFSGKRFWEGGHESAGVAEPATSWFHAEGSTGPFFDEYVLVGNPGVSPATVTFTFLLSTGQTVVTRLGLGRQSRFTVDVENVAAYVATGAMTLVAGDPALLRDAAVSATVTSDVPVISERAMYWGGSFTTWYEAHNSFGVTRTAARWGLAEGRVGSARGYETYILLANPNAADIDVRVALLRQDGRPPIARTFRVGATSRFNVFVNDDGWAAAGLEAGEGFGAIVESLDPSKPIAVERAMYWFGADPLFWTGGTNATAVPLP